MSHIKPDWHAPETVRVSNLEKSGYYVSQSIIGKMFRKIELPDAPRSHQRARDQDQKTGLATLSLKTLSLDDPISTILHRILTSYVDLDHPEDMSSAISGLFDHFSVELEFIGYSCSLAKHGARRLSEEELLVGTIAAKTTQFRIRQDSMASMREQTTILVQRTLKELQGSENDSILEWANRAWMAWKVSLMKKRVFGARSFGFMALHAILEVIEVMEQAGD
jgi:hypothetical protein